MNQLIQKVVAFTQCRYIRILTNGFMSVAAISVCGSIFSLIKSLPIPVWQTFLTNSGLGSLLSIPIAITTDLMAVYIALGMGFTIGKEFKENAFASATVALGSFMLLTPFEVVQNVKNAAGEVILESYTVTGVIPVSSLGAKGIFLAMIAGLLSARLYVFILGKGWKIKLPDSVPENVCKMFETMIPGGLVFTAFMLARWGFSMTPYGTAQDFIYKLLQTPLMAVGGGLIGALVVVTVGRFLWCFGVHGPMVVYSAMASVVTTVSTANASAFAAGTPIPYVEWAWVNFLVPFGNLPLTLVMALTAKSSQYKALGKISFPTSLFGIGEPLVYGMPVVMNPIIDIPFVLLQPVNLLLTVFVTKIGVLATPTGAPINAMIPAPIQAALKVGHWSGFVWAVILIAIDMAVYYPFFKVLDKKALAEEAAAEAEGEAA